MRRRTPHPWLEHSVIARGGRALGRRCGCGSAPGAARQAVRRRLRILREAVGRQPLPLLGATVLMALLVHGVIETQRQRALPLRWLLWQAALALAACLALRTRGAWSALRQGSRCWRWWSARTRGRG